MMIERLKLKFSSLGYSGELCENEYNECESSPCLNGGQCLNRTGEVRCQCPKGFQGTICELKVNCNFCRDFLWICLCFSCYATQILAKMLERVGL